MRTQFAILILFVFGISAPGFAMRVIQERGIEMHETTTESFVEIFVDDVLSLLPRDLAQQLEAEKAILMRYARFTPRDDYWSSPAIRRERFIASHGGRVDGKTGEKLARNLGGTVQDIFEVAMTPGQEDVFGEGLKRNLVTVLEQGKHRTYTVTYRGFPNESIPQIVGRLYALQAYRKLDIYPDLVTVTADLWTAMWLQEGGQAGSRTKYFVRRPLMPASAFGKSLTGKTPASKRGRQTTAAGARSDRSD